MSNANPKRSLLEKISGPKAVPLTALVIRGEAAAQRVQESFGDFLDGRIRELIDARPRLLGASNEPSAAVWDQFYALAVDLRGSAAMVNRQDLGEVCRSLEALLKDHVRDPRAAAVVASHIDALVLVSSGQESEDSVRRLTRELVQAVARIPAKAGL